MKTSVHISLGVLAAALLLGGVAGCGNKGPLVMPARPAPAAAPVLPDPVDNAPADEVPADEVPASDEPLDGIPAEDEPAAPAPGADLG